MPNIGRKSFSSRLAAAGLLAGVLCIAPVHAQQDTTTSNAATTNPGTATSPGASNSTITATNPGTETVTTRYDDRRGFDWGWLGLVGLLGLFGLRRPTNVVYQDRDRTYPDRTTTR
jgi:MYXO-CTERM domain-containing protein